MLRRLSEAASRAARPLQTPPADVPPVPPLPTSDSSNSLSSPALTEALSYDIVTSPQPERIAHAREDLLHALEDLQNAQAGDLEARLSALATIQLVLQEHDARDLLTAFSTHGGFEVVVGALASLDGIPAPAALEGEKDGQENKEVGEGVDDMPEDDLRYHLATLILHVLHLALRLPANCDALSFSALSSAFDLSGLIGPNSTIEEKARTFSLIWAFLVGDFSEGASALLVVRSKVLEQLDPVSSSVETPSTLATVRSVVASRRLDTQPEKVVHPSVVSLLLDLLESKLDPLVEAEAQLRLTVLALIASLLDGRAGERSVVRLSEAGLLRESLRRILPSHGGEAAAAKGSGDEREIWLGITRDMLSKLGARGKDASELFRAVGESKKLDVEMLQLILDTMPTSRNPPFVEFDFTRSGSSCLNVRSLGRPFPPATHGYSFLAWICVEVSPTTSPLIILGATDPSSKTFFEFSLTPSLHFAVQTSLRTPPVEFSDYTLAPGEYHHVALVHQRPKFTSQSTASLYVDGVLVDTVKLAYPAAPPKDWDVAAWLGTPAERAQTAPVATTSKADGPRWKLGPTWLVHGDLQEEFVQVCYRLGARYEGNFQDILGRFLTNSAASTINVKLDGLVRDASAQKTRSSAVASSPLIYALRHKGSAILPEHRIYFSFSASNLLSVAPPIGIHLAPTPRAAETLKLAVASRDAAIVNAAVPAKIEDAVVKLNGLAFVEHATVGRPRGLDDAIWAHGGTTMLLSWVDKASSSKELEVAVRVLVEALRDSWRLTEEAEERHAYEILGLLLRRKATFITASVHDAILSLAGFDLAQPAKSVVVNPLACQHLVLDFSLWTAADPAVQWAHFDRLRDLMTTSETADYNLKKLQKQHIVRKLLFAIRSRLFDEALLDEIVDLLMLIVSGNLATDTIRYLATYLAASLTTDSTKGKQPAKAHEQPSTFVYDVQQLDAGRYRAPIRILQKLHDLLLDPEQTTALAKWAKHVRSKWVLALLQDRHTPPHAAVLVTRILVRLLQSQGPAYTAKFVNSDSGLSILRASLPRFWYLGQLDLALFALLHNHDISTHSLDAPLQPSLFLASADSAITSAPEVLRIILAVLGRGLKVLDDLRMNGADLAAPEDATATETLDTGFASLVDLLAQAGRATAEGTDWPLLASPVALSDLIHILRPTLRLPSLPEYPPTAEPPALPVISSVNGFEIAEPAVPNRPPASATASPSLTLDVASLSNDSASQPSPLSALDVQGAVSSETGPVIPAALLILDVLAQQVTNGITTRDSRQPVTLAPTLAHFPSSDPALQPLRLILDAGATSDARSQVVFRTLLFAECVRRLARASMSPVVSARIAAFVEVATAFAYQGWLADVHGLLSFTLAYLEKLVDETALAALPDRDEPVQALYSSLNRLILLGLLNPLSSPRTLELIAHHQLVAFSPQNEQTEQLQLLVYRLAKLAADDKVGQSAIHALKLLALQRAQDIDEAFQQKRHEAEEPFTNRLVQADDADLVAILGEHDDLLAPLGRAWDKFVANEQLQARTTIDLEMARLRDLANSLLENGESQSAAASEPVDQATDEPAVEEDKQRKIIRLLEAGDEFQAVYNVSSIRGVDAHPALLLIGRKNVYLVEGYHHTASGEVVDSWDAPDEAKLFFADGQSFLLTFSQGRQAEALNDLADKNPEAVASGSVHFSSSSFGSKLSDALVGQRTKLERMTKRWEQRQVSNFEYLMFLNTLAGRTYSDLTTYPVFPWILADYDSDELDLNDERTFRDLTKPMGCQSPERMREFQERYAQLAELDGPDDPKPFHYGTHYTSAMIASGYLIRLAPFTEAYLDLQGGSFDHADRLFWSVKRAWESASADVRELIPEFFYLPDFLTNANGLEFGRRQENDALIDDVQLPPWAKGNPRLFVELHRQALESEYVGTHLHAWIDLVFGYKQRGEAAVNAVNCFSELSYEGAIDLDTVDDPEQRKAATSVIHNFGMTPRQLFTHPHPLRRARLVPKATHTLFAPDLPVERVVQTLVQCISPIATLERGTFIASIAGPPSPSMPDKLRIESPQTLSAPGDPTVSVHFGFGDNGLRVYERNASLPLSLEEGGHLGRVTAACFADSTTLVTAADEQHANLKRLASLRGGHSVRVVSLATSKAFAVIASGDEEGGVVLWDLNRLRPVRHLEGHEEAVQAVAISSTTGDIVTCSGATMRVWTVNGILLATHSTGSAAFPITSVAWSKSETSPLLATGHAFGRVSLFKRVPSSAPTGWDLQLVHSLRLEDRLKPSTSPSPSSPSRRARRSTLPSQAGDTVTALTFTSRTLYAGTDEGKVHLLNPPPSELFLPDSAAAACMACGTKFTLLETRRRCAACAGVFCNLDVTRSVEAGGRYCGDCFSQLSPLLVH
ncbi:hypothetical protein Rhopal_000090-T1 [Rhodotorula paludigena]|uniref:Beige protein homolog 1 n=1 Tax=Rhodotorula paludigena TaxID=86838 RepID=A0AAV5GBK4_9BASI|nr:hypothetical protein Rhopal_000090-T1 [Rhodotorula paludigena]